MARNDLPTNDITEDGSATPSPAPAERARRATSPTTKRILLVILGVAVVLASIAGFYLTSDAFDERTEVLVAAVDLPAGTILGPEDLTSALADMGQIPHTPWAPELADALAGLLVTEDIPLGAAVQQHLLVLPDNLPDGDELEVIVPLDASLAPSGVVEGDVVLLIDPGVAPSTDDPGRPRRVIGPPLELQNFDGASVKLFVPPEEWAQWRQLPTDLGATPLVLPVSVGGDPTDMSERLDAVWYGEWSAAVDAVAAAVPVVEPEPAAGPGELEVVVPLDASLVPSGVAEGDLVLLVDPGVPPAGNDIGRPRSVLDPKIPLRLENFDGSAIRLFVPPADWAVWRALPAELGGAPMVVPVPEGSDPADMVRRLDAGWLAAWEDSVEHVTTPGPGQFLVTLPLDPSLSPGGVGNGDLVFIIDPGRPGDPGDPENPGKPPRIMESRILNGWDGSVTRFWETPDRWAFYTFLPQRLGAVPWVMAVTVPVAPGEVEALTDRINAALAQHYPSG